MNYIINEEKLTFDEALEHIIENLDHELYDDFIDETTEEVEIWGMKFSPSRVIKELDETAYNCGYNDWQNSMRDEIDNELSRMDDEEEADIYGTDVLCKDDEEEDEEEEE